VAPLFVHRGAGEIGVVGAVKHSVMTTLSFIPSVMRSWHVAQQGGNAVHVTGWALVEGRLACDKALADLLLTKVSKSDDSEWIPLDLDGNFAMVLQTLERIVLIADPIRSIPLFFSKNGEILYVSDDARNLEMVDRSLDNQSVVEFSTAGYVTGPHNIYMGVSGLRAGEWVQWSTESRQPLSRRYFSYACTFDSPLSIDELCDEFDQALVTTFTRLIESIGGRQIVIPLSGGLDSRLVVAMFKRLGYDNLICLSYGVPGNPDSMKSRAVAELLGYPWKFVEYSPELWRSTFKGDGIDRYMKFASNGVSMPFTGDWPAVKALYDDSAIASDAVIVPGHTGDFISGGHLKYLLDPKFFDLSAGFDSAMIKKHYSLWYDLASEPVIKAVVGRRLVEAVGYFESASDEDLSRKYEYWEWQERQSKYIINSVRSYESFGFSWRLPLWSREIMDFWRRVPIDLKMEQYLYREYLSSSDHYSLFQSDAPATARNGLLVEQRASFRGRVKERLTKFRFGLKLVMAVTRFQSHVKGYKRDPLGMAFLYSFPRFLFRDVTKRNVLSLMVQDFLHREYGVRRSSVRAFAEAEQVQESSQ
jgi:asparagine synthase (glutamine-hydrolysing)